MKSLSDVVNDNEDCSGVISSTPCSRLTAELVSIGLVMWL